jgi:hypothetical protein
MSTPGHLNMDTRIEAITLRRDHPEIARHAYISGAWIWVKFDEKPDASTIETLKSRGYKWASKKREWYNSCGIKARKRKKNGAPINHRQLHGVVEVNPDDSAVAVKELAKE